MSFTFNTDPVYRLQPPSTDAVSNALNRAREPPPSPGLGAAETAALNSGAIRLSADDGYNLISSNGDMFASANFLDANEMTPLGALFDIGGNGSPTPYMTGVGAMIQKQADEVRKKVEGKINAQRGWRTRVRDYIATQNNELLEFLNMKVTAHPTLGPGEVLLKRFGNPQVHPNHPSVREFVMDASGEDVIADISTALANFKGEGGVQDYVNQTMMIYEEYRNAGRDLVKCEAALNEKLKRLDRMQDKIKGVFEIDANDAYGEVLEVVEKYLKKVYEENQIEEDYRGLIAAYRRFNCLRELIQMSRSLTVQENEPLCCICLEGTVSYALTPCGHTYCSSCVKKPHLQCFLCRGHVKDRVKLFFG
jgi:hypothetical protein